MTHSFEDIQARFVEALHDSRRETLLTQDISTAQNIAGKRIDIYRHNEQAHLRAALINAYPVLRALAGDRYFHDYALAYPSQGGDLNAFGDHLATFIEDREREPQRAHFADMARLEWAVHTAYYAADVTGLSVAQWQSMDSEALLMSRLGVHPACVPLRAHYDVFSIWRAHQTGATLPACADTPACGLVVRPQWRPYVIEQSIAAHEAFNALQQGRTLTEAIDIALDRDPAFDLVAALQGWIEAGAITGLAAVDNA